MRAILLTFIVSWVFFFIAMFFLGKEAHFVILSSNNKDFLSDNFTFPFTTPAYKFINSALANKILSQLDVSKYPITRVNASGIGLYHDNEYCGLHREYFTEHPEVVFDQMNFVTDTLLDSLFRTKIIPSLGQDIHPEVGAHMSVEEKERNNPLKLEANMFLFRFGFFTGMTVGQHYSCLSQISNHIPGHDYLNSKDLVAKAAITYAKLFEYRTECFNFDKIFPKTWILYEKEDCIDFFKAFNSPEYKKLKEERGIVYISKIARYAHRAEGVTPVQEEEEKRLRTIYDNGKKCGEVTQQYIIQNYIHNTLLLNGHRFDFRIYMLIASTNPVIAYYHDGIVRFTLTEYDTSSKDKKTLLPNAAVNDEIYNKVKEDGVYEGMDEETLRRAHRKSYDEVQALLLESGATNDPNWIDNHLRPEVKKAMVHLLRMTSKYFWRHSSLFELQGLDFVIDSDLNLWFIEANASPAIAKFSIPMEKFIVKMLCDQYEIVFGLLRSRMKRVINFVNEMIENGEAKETSPGKVVIENFQVKKEEFNEISKNYFEDEFLPHANNGFVMIFNQNYEGVERFGGLISEECL